MTTRLGAVRAIQVGLGTVVALMGLSLVGQNRVSAIALIIAFGLAMGLLFISIIPFALAGIPLTQAGLSTGLYFGGSGLAGAIASLLLRSDGVTPTSAFGWAIVSFLFTTLCLHITLFSTQHQGVRSKKL